MVSILDIGYLGWRFTFQGILRLFNFNRIAGSERIPVVPAHSDALSWAVNTLLKTLDCSELQLAFFSIKATVINSLRQSNCGCLKLLQMCFLHKMIGIIGYGVGTFCLINF